MQSLNLPQGRGNAEKVKLDGGERILRFTVAAAILAYVGFAWRHRPGEGEYSICLFRAVTGLPCPSCGLTHGIHLLLSGRFRESLSAFPLTAFYMAVLSAAALVLGREGIQGRILVSARVRQGAAAFAVMLVFAGWLLRFLKAS